MPEWPGQREWEALVARFEELKARLESTVRTVRRVFLALLVMQALTLALLGGVVWRLMTT